MASSTNCSSSVSSIEDKQFDFVVVGGGTTGLVLANRLTEDPDVRVLVVEAGAERQNDPKILTPGMMGALYNDPQYDWDYATEPQEHLNNRQIPQPRGRVLGGTSALNFSVVLYPSRADLDGWASLGNRGWEFDNLAPYYRKIATLHLPTEETKNLVNINYLDDHTVSQKGPLQFSFGNGYSPANKAFADTFAKLGYEMTEDPINGRGLGALIHPASIDPATKTRSYATTAYYTAEVAARPNLRILTEAHVEKVLLETNPDNGGDATATGVQFTAQDGKQHSVSAKSEVIVSGGSLHSPKILELSGIGGKALLESHGIPVVIDNPNVGENMQDHAVVAQTYEVDDGVLTIDVLRDPEVLNAAVAQYQTDRDGPLASSNMSSSFMPAMDAEGRTSPEKLHALVDKQLNNYHDFPAREAQYNILQKTLEDPQQSSVQNLFFPGQTTLYPTGLTTMSEAMVPVASENYITILTSLNRPFSRGHCHIQSADPTKKPLYDPRFCSHPLDMEILARHAQWVEKFIAMEPMASVFKKEGKRVPDIHATAADGSSPDLEAAREIVRQRQISLFHPAGTCAMMPREIGGVVNERLVVHGTKNLRVIDASIFPLEPLGNIQTSVYAVAERAADLIKEDWKKA